MGTVTGTSRGFRTYIIIIGYEMQSAAMDYNDAAAGSSAFCKFNLPGALQETKQEVVAAHPFTIDLSPHMSGKSIVPGSLDFTWGGVRYVERTGRVYKEPSQNSGIGVDSGSINYETGEITLDQYDGGANEFTVNSILLRSGAQFTTAVTFRTPGAPLRPGSFTVQATASDGTLLSGTANFDGSIDDTGMDGWMDVETGIVDLQFGEFVLAAGNEGEDWYDEALLDGANIWKPILAVADTITYNCVVYSYIPLDADLIGIDPVRLPTDGRVPVVRSGDVVVIHSTKTDQLANPLAAGQVITLSRGNISQVELFDTDGVYVPTTKYSFDKEAQELIMADPLDLAGFTQPLIANHRIEDMRLVSDVQINGQITLTAGVNNPYEVDSTYVSSALLFGDLRARLYNMYDQKTWTNVWSNDLIGDPCTANFNDVNFPPVVLNSGSITERWALIFTDSTTFNIVGEKMGVIGVGYTTVTCAPVNPASPGGSPYFTIDSDGWGAGWATNNVIRFNTDGTGKPLWIARTTLSGEVTEPDDFFKLQIRGDAE